MQKAKTEKIKLGRKLKVLPLVFVGLVLISVFFVLYVRKLNVCREVYHRDLRDVKLSQRSEQLVDFEVADTVDERVRGLSGKKCIQENQGMLFSFEIADRHSFWMKDMKFPIDIVWLDSDKKVIYMVENASLKSYPNVFRPTASAQYVIELRAGVASRLQIQNGDQLSW